MSSFDEDQVALSLFFVGRGRVTKLRATHNVPGNWRTTVAEIDVEAGTNADEALALAFTQLLAKLSSKGLHLLSVIDSPHGNSRHKILVVNTSHSE